MQSSLLLWSFSVFVLRTVQVIGTSAHQVFPEIHVGIVSGKADDKGLRRIYDADVVAEPVVLPGLVGDIDLAADFSVLHGKLWD